MKKILLLIIPLFCLVGCDKIPSEVVDPKPNDFQVIKIIAPDVFVYNQNDSSFITSVKLKSSTDISEIWLDFYSSDSKKLNNEKITLDDNGNLANGDTTKGDNIFSAKLSLSKYDPVGQYLVEYFLIDNSDFISKIGIHNFNYYNGQQNYPPIVSKLSAPDSIKLTVKEIFLNVSVLATDYNGLKDLKEVFFNSFIPPDGNPSKSNPIMMYDDGTHGDTNSDDGLFTVTVILPPTGVTKGIYRWEFQAKDRSDSLSNKIIHNVIIL